MLLASVLALVWFAGRLAGQIPKPPPLGRGATAALVMLVLVQCWVLLQLVPLPLDLIRRLSPQAFNHWQAVSPVLPRLSLDPTATRIHFLLGSAYTLIFALTLFLLNSPRRFKILAGTLVLSGLFQAVYGIAMVWSGQEYGFLVEKYVNKGSVTGTFVNRNHFAGYAALSLSMAIGLFLSSPVLNDWQTHRQRFRSALQLLLSQAILLRVALAVLVLGLLLSKSRMGNLAFFSALLLASCVYLSLTRCWSRRLAWLLGGMLLIDVLIVGSLFGGEQVFNRVLQTDLGQEGRVWSMRYTFTMLGDFPLTGTGAGSFSEVFPVYQGVQLPDFHEHVHNDYLEFAVELGLPAFLLLTGVVGLATWSALATIKYRSRGLRVGLSFGVLLAIFWLGLHSLADFNLQIPANALTLIVLLAMAFCLSRDFPAQSG